MVRRRQFLRHHRLVRLRWTITVSLLCVAGLSSAQDSVQLALPVVIGAPGAGVSVPVLVEGFDDLDGYQFRLNWDTSRLTFDGLEQLAPLPGLTNGSFGTGQTEQGFLIAAWSNPTGTGATLPGGDTLFAVRFVVRPDALGFAAVAVPPPPPPRLFFRFEDSNLVNLGSGVQDGGVNAFAPLVVDSVTVTASLCADAAAGFIQVDASGGIPPYSILWNDGATTLNRPNLPAGTYSFTLTDQTGQSVERSGLIVAAGELPALDLGVDTSFCAGDDVLLEPVSATDFVNTRWWRNGTDLDADGASLYVANLPGTYVLETESAAGCTVRDTLVLTARAAPSASAHPLPEGPLCAGDSLHLVAGGGTVHTWSFGEQEQRSDSLLIAPDTTTTVRLLATNDCGVDTLDFTLAVALPVGAAGPDTCIALRRTAQLSVTGGVAYRWRANDFLSTTTEQRPLVTPLLTTTFLVEIESERGCVRLDSMRVEVLTFSEANLDRINVLTPNGDGQNDALVFRELSKSTLNELTVYNRWGTVVYRRINYQNDWMGTLDGRSLPAGNYYYVLRVGAAEPIRSLLTILR